MKPTTKLLAPALLSVSLLTACEAPNLNVFPPDVVVVSESETGVDVSPPQRLDVVMTNDAGWIERCNDMGGAPQIARRVCQDVDY